MNAERKPQENLTLRVEALRDSEKSFAQIPEVEALREAVLCELEDWRNGLVISPCNLLLALEALEEA